MSNNSEKKLNGTVIVTYRCNARCSMCNRYKAPSKPEEEISIETIKKLPKMYFTNITGGEPFIRTDLKDIVRELYKKSDRIVISTNGFFTDRIVDLCKEFPQIGIRLSLVLPCYNVMKYLPKCLDSIFKNDCSNVEIILVNDGSSDDIGGGVKPIF